MSRNSERIVTIGATTCESRYERAGSTRVYSIIEKNTCKTESLTVTSLLDIRKPFN
jgi:hypothetical protein